MAREVKSFWSVLDVEVPSKDSLRSFPQYTLQLASCRPVPEFEVLGEEALDSQAELTLTVPPFVSALNPNCSLGFSPLGVCRLESDL